MVLTNIFYSNCISELGDGWGPTILDNQEEFNFLKEAMRKEDYLFLVMMTPLIMVALLVYTSSIMATTLIAIPTTFLHILGLTTPLIQVTQYKYG